MWLVFFHRRGLSRLARAPKTGLAEELTLAKAIKHARQIGREHHERTGLAVIVELVIPEKSLLLEQHLRRTRLDKADA